MPEHFNKPFLEISEFGNALTLMDNHITLMVMIFMLVIAEFLNIIIVKMPENNIAELAVFTYTLLFESFHCLI